MSSNDPQQGTNPLKRRDVYRAIDYERNVEQTKAPDGSDATVIGEEFGNLLGTLDAFVFGLAMNNSLPFEEIVGKNKYSAVKENPLAYYFKLMPAFINEFCEDRTYSPEVKVFFDVVREMNLEHEVFRGPAAPSFTVAGTPVWKVFNDFVVKLRERCLTSKFRNAVSRCEFNATRARRSLQAYVDALQGRYARMLVTRIDFYYTGDRKNISAEDAHKDLKRLLNNKRSNSIFRHMVGYIWKLEYGELRGHHFHAFFFFDGSRVHKDEFLTELIGKYWIQITEGKGGFFNCNRAKHLYNRCGIGMISHSDPEMRANLMLAIDYLTKKDQFLRAKSGSRVRAIGRGEIPRLQPSGLGRPRKTSAGGDEKGPA